MAKLYGLLAEFANNTEVEKLKRDTIQAKKSIINAFAILDTDNWDKVQEEVTNAERKMVEIMSEISKTEDKRKFNVNKSYILIEELKNSLATHDKGIFYLKYKNLIEELNTLV